MTRRQSLAVESVKSPPCPLVLQSFNDVVEEARSMLQIFQAPLDPVSRLHAFHLVSNTVFELG
jgi:hypothetical protein